MKTRKGIAVICWVIVLVIIISASLVYKSEAEPVDTHHEGWFLIRALDNQDAANDIDNATTPVLDLDGAAGDFASKPSGAFQITSSNRGISKGGAWIFAICGTDDVDEDLDFDVVGWAKRNGMAQVMCQGTGILGSQDVVLYPDTGATATAAFWADTIVVTDKSNWPGYIGVFDSGNNHVCIVVLDMTGIEWVQWLFHDTDGGSEATSVAVYGRPY